MNDHTAVIEPAFFEGEKKKLKRICSLYEFKLLNSAWKTNVVSIMEIVNDREPWQGCALTEGPCCDKG